MGVKGRWFRRGPSDEEMREELEAHIAMRAEHDGVNEVAARRRLGNVLQTREAMRRVWIAEWWDALRQDAHYTWRSWRRRPAFAGAAILVLSLGLGASTALFAALDRVLFRPLPYADPDRIVSVGRITVPLVFEGQTETIVDTFYLQQWDKTPAPFQSMTAIVPLVGTRTCDAAEGQPEGLRCDLVEHNFLRVLGRSVALGRDFVPQDDVRGAPQVAIISHALWVRRFGADPGVLDRTLSLERAGPIRFRSVTPQYFETFRIPVVEGRMFQAADVTGEPAVAINESAERALFAGERALGRRIRFPPMPSIPGVPAVPRPWYTVVGVTADVRNGQTLTDTPNPEVYFAARPGRWVDLLPAGPRGVLSLRTAIRPDDATAFLRQIAADLDPRQIVTIQTGDELFTTATAQPRFIAWLLTAFAALALLLAAAGLYSVASYLVLQRRRDIGVRMAIGASPRDVARQVVGEAGRWIIGGAVAGAALGWIGTRALQSQLYEVQTLDPWSWTGALLALAVVLVIAVFRPASRAAHVDPVAALRAD